MTENIVKPALFLAFWMAFVVAFASLAHAGPNDGVKGLQAIHAEYVKLSKNKEAKADIERNKLMHEATDAVHKIADAKTKKISAQQVKAFASVIAESVSLDPVTAIVGNNLEIIEANQKAFDKEFARLPKEKRQPILQAIKVFKDERTR